MDKIGVVEKLSLYLYTRGGDTAAAWNVINLLRMFCDEFQVIIPHKAHSAGTLISIGANSIIMTKQATLGPIDPSINTALNPHIPGAPLHITMPVSVEAVKGYLEFAKEELHIKDDIALSNIMIKLSDMVHPLTLGQVYRSRSQIKMLAEKLLINQVSEQSRIQEIISFLCSDSGSHDYTINRREARDHLGLNIITPSEEQYVVIKKIYDDINDELKFDAPFDPSLLLGGNLEGANRYEIRKGLLESINGGSYCYINEGIVIADATGRNVKESHRLFEGWKHEENENEPTN